MFKKLKIFIPISLALIIVVFSSLAAGKAIAAKKPESSNVNLEVDSLKHADVLPKHYRKTTDLSAIKGNKALNLKGMDKLNISGSEQFSESNLPLLIKAIGTSLPITVVDLREESHGFINGLEVSWVDSKNNANAGLTREQVLQDETNKLKSIRLNEPISFYNKPTETIIPQKVQDENSLVSSKGLFYNRITVRDGGIPSDDMVDYFIESVRALQQNSWLHFHCKRGIGRTTTFMIMYDMMRNYKEASADDIIKRQLALGNLDEKAVTSFYNKERMDFLKKFYDYCKANGDSFNIRWSDWKKNSSATSFTPSYIKNKAIPSSLYVVSQDSMTNSERTMVASLQGLVNGHCSFQIYTLNSSEPDYKIWLEDLKNNYNVSYKVISDPWTMLNEYRSYIDGYVLYSSKNPKDPSINNACSLAGLSKAIVIDEALEDKVRNIGITKIIGDCRNTDEEWAYNNLWNKGLNHSIVIQLAPEKAGPLRDYAVMTKSLAFYEDSVDKTALRTKIFLSMENNPTCLGWGPDEFVNVSTASKCGVSVVPADWAYNLTTLSSFPSIPVTKKSTPPIPKEENVHYVTFIMSDGDNLQWNLGTNYGSPRWFGYPDRSRLCLGWTMSPSLYYLAPTVFNLYYKSISSENRDNDFAVSPSGNGYIYPSKFERSKLSAYVETLRDYMKKTDEKYVTVIDDASFEDTELWIKFTEKSGIEGLFYLDYRRHDNYKGRILWSNNKPVVACRDLLWNKLEDENELVKRINERVVSGQVNVHSPEAYTFVYVHAWSKDVQNVHEVEGRLRENPKVRIVTPETFIRLIKTNI